MYSQNTSQVAMLGEELQDRPKRRSVFIENGLNSPGPLRVAPAPVNFINKPSEAFKKNGLIYDVLKPMYLLMKIVGIFPVANNGRGEFRLAPQWLAYSAAIFLAMLGYVLYIELNSVEIVRSQEGRFEEAVIDYLFTVYLVPILVTPLIWYEGRKLATVVTNWGYVEGVYNKVTKKKLEVFLGSKPVTLSIVLPFIASATMVVTHVTMSRFNVVKVIPYCYINSLIYLIAGFWFMQCDVMGKVATQVADDFQRALKHIGPTSQVADYRSLWMILSKLVRDIGNAFGYTLTFLCLYLFLVITLTIYGLLSQIQAGFSGKDIGLTINAALATAILFFICDEAHYASSCVRVHFQKKLLLVELTWMNDDAQQEINMFLRATEMSPTDISLVGFFDVNRNLFKSLLATMVTYLVVLLQFQISIPEDTRVDTNGTFVAFTTQAPK